MLVTCRKAKLKAAVLANPICEATVCNRVSCRNLIDGKDDPGPLSPSLVGQSRLDGETGG